MKEEFQNFDLGEAGATEQILRRDFLKKISKGLAFGMAGASLPLSANSAFASAANATPRIMLGIDVLQALKFSSLRGKRVGLLTHPAGVNRLGRSSIEVLRSSPSVRLTALFGPEHGIYGNEKADVPVLDNIDPKTKLPVYSLYGKYRKPSPEMLKKIDVLVVDLQDIGSRSYTYVSCMIRAMEACFENGKEIIILDRPNPLGGLKVDGPPRDEKFKSYVGMLSVPYVHGLTIGELARFAKNTENSLEITSKQRKNGKLTIIPMRGWRRSMMWTDTNLKWVPTSPAIPTPAAAMGYSMTGLGAQIGGFQHGYGTSYPFRMLTFPNKTPEQIAEALRRCEIEGLVYKPVTAISGVKKVRGLYVGVNNWRTLKPTEISFHMMRLACSFTGKNPFASSKAATASLFNKHTGCGEWWKEISTKGAKADVQKFMRRWELYCKSFQERTKIFRLYS